VVDGDVLSENAGSGSPQAAAHLGSYGAVTLDDVEAILDIR
jgi:hypothetical protein